MINSATPEEVSRPQTELPEWMVESLRLTAFPRDPSGINAEGAWERVTGAKPTENMSRPNEGLLVEHGPFPPAQNANLTVRCQPFRTDWILSAPPLAEDEPLRLPIVGKAAFLIPAFREAMSAWLPTSPVLGRLAFGAVLLLEVKDHVAGYLALARFLPTVKIDPNARDISFQVNRRRRYKSGEQDIEINRLSKWSVVRVTSVSVSLSSGIDVQAAAAQSNPLFACRAELDINTAIESKPTFSSAELVPLFTHIANLAAEIIAKGDVE
jgi:hypothetical protein